jgi:hypothetical protein
MILLRSLFLVLFLLGQLSFLAWPENIGIYQHGTIVRMRVGDCLPDHGFMAALSGPSAPQPKQACPEYTLVADNVIYIIVGRPSKDVLPLAETIDFRLRKNEIAVRLDDARREVRFMVREMALRTEWEHRRDEQEQMHGARRFEMPMLRSD